MEPAFASKSSSKEARVTQIVREVKLLPAEADTRDAAMNDRVAENTGVRTGNQARSELTFTDLTITRLGANSIYSYGRGGRDVEFGGGSILLRVPKDSGGAKITGAIVSVAVTGTTLILENARGGRSKLYMLEGGARLALVRNPSETRFVQAGQLLDVPAGATTLPNPVNFDLNQLMQSHPLIVGFPPLPSQGLIAAVASRQKPSPGPDEPIYQGQPVGGGPVVTSGGIGLPGLQLPPGIFGGSSGGVRNPAGTSNPNGYPNGGSPLPNRGRTSKASKSANDPKSTPPPVR